MAFGGESPKELVKVTLADTATAAPEGWLMDQSPVTTLSPELGGKS